MIFSDEFDMHKSWLPIFEKRFEEAERERFAALSALTNLKHDLLDHRLRHADIDAPGDQFQIVYADCTQVYEFCELVDERVCAYEINAKGKKLKTKLRLDFKAAFRLTPVGKAEWNPPNE